jgi:hypothetical protein
MAKVLETIYVKDRKIARVGFSEVYRASLLACEFE